VNDPWVGAERVHRAEPGSVTPGSHFHVQSEARPGAAQPGQADLRLVMKKGAAQGPHFRTDSAPDGDSLTHTGSFTIPIGTAAGAA
jgi:hypothetical protein